MNRRASFDLLCLSKAFSGGYLPLSVVLCRDVIYDSFLDDGMARAFLHSHSYTGNPLACRAALATLDIFASDDVLAVNREKAQKISAAFVPLAHHPQVRHLRQRGMIAAFDVTTDDPVLPPLLPRRPGSRCPATPHWQHGRLRLTSSAMKKSRNWGKLLSRHSETHSTTPSNERKNRKFTLSTCLRGGPHFCRPKQLGTHIITL